jgi:MSHA biogenesis protein MshQ
VSDPILSTDLFAIRPSAVTLASTTAKAYGDSYGVSDLTRNAANPPKPAATPTVAAGVAFPITAVAAPNASPNAYSGVLYLDASKLTAQKTLIGSAPEDGGVVGGMSLDPLTVNGTSYTNALQANGAQGNAYYSEVGYLYANPGAFSDNGEFTQVDWNSTCAGSNSCDCWMPTNSASDTSYLSVTPIDSPDKKGRFGCYVGNSTTFVFGRFIPHHFSTIVKGPMSSTTVGQNTWPSTFIYSGQVMTLASDPAVGASVVAKSGGQTSVKTQNYAGSFAREVTLSAASSQGGAVLDSATIGILAPSNVAAADFTAGAATVPSPTYTFRTVPTVPTEVHLRAVEIAGDGVTSLQSPAAASDEGGVEVVSGRLRLSNVSGAGRSNLSMMLQAQYWTGALWALNGADATALSKSGFALSGYAASAASGGTVLAAGNFDASHLTLAGGSGCTATSCQSNQGRWTLTLTPPTPAAAGSVYLTANLGAVGTTNDNCLGAAASGMGVPWLRAGKGSCGITQSATGPYDPMARITFGIYNAPTIHVRELY